MTAIDWVFVAAVAMQWIALGLDYLTARLEKKARAQHIAMLKACHKQWLEVAKEIEFQVDRIHPPKQVQ
jgi:hypothetical protein